MDLTHSTPALMASLVMAVAETQNATKNATNPHLKSKYANLDAVLDSVKPVFAKHGLAVIQSPGFDGVVVTVTTAVVHEMGGYISMTAGCLPAKADPQGVGSATTYLRRYALAALGCITQEDDDGSGASRKPGAEPEAVGNPRLEERAALRACGSEGALREAWKALPDDARADLGDFVKECREAIKQADKEAM